MHAGRRVDDGTRGDVLTTTALGPIRAPRPILTAPMITAPTPISTSSSMIGQSEVLSRFPRVTCCRIMTPRPIRVAGLTTIPTP